MINSGLAAVAVLASALGAAAGALAAVLKNRRDAKRHA